MIELLGEGVMELLGEGLVNDCHSAPPRTGKLQEFSQVDRVRELAA